MPCLSDMPNNIMQQIIKESDFKSVLTLRKVCKEFRNFIDALDEILLPDNKFTRIQIFAKPSGILLKFDIRNIIDLIVYQIKENGNCDRMHDKKHTILKDVDVVDIALKDLELILKFQKNCLQSSTFNMTFWPGEDSDERSIATLFAEKLKILLKSKLFKTENLRISAFTQNEVMSVFPYVDSDTLKRIWIDRPFLSSLRDQEKVVMKMDEIVKTKQWKNAEEISILSFEFSEPLETLQHFCVMNINVGLISAQNLNNLRKHFSNSSKFIKFYIGYEELTDIEELRRLWGQSCKDRVTGEQKWFFRMTSYTDVMEVRSKSGEFPYFDFSRIEFNQVPHGAAIQE